MRPAARPQPHAAVPLLQLSTRPNIPGEATAAGVRPQVKVMHSAAQRGAAHLDVHGGLDQRLPLAHQRAQLVGGQVHALQPTRPDTTRHGGRSE